MPFQPTQVLRTLPTEIPSSTKPLHVVTDAGNGYLKLVGNPQGKPALVSELVSIQLAEWLGLPVFSYAVMDVAEADVDPHSNDVALNPAFITREEPGDPWEGTPQELVKVENVDDLSRLVVLDTWIGNVDRYVVNERRGEQVPHRNDRNLFLSGDASPGKFRAMAYDHTHCHLALIAASPSGDLDGKIEDERIFGLFPEFAKLLDRDAVRATAQRLGELDSVTIEQIVQSVPDEWIVDPAIRERLAEFIERRSDFVSRQIERKLFPQGELFHD
ncbi:hypothetical protein GC176_08350 [bacterium]|nr:hypothetical protein [bacterium]